jgi:hypothetical protein
VGHDNQVRINQIQTVGTHNSFHVEITDQEKAIREQAQPGSGTGGEEYSHAPIQQQLDGQKVRQLEFDLAQDPDGGRFTNPILRQISGEGSWNPDVMNKPGIKVLHEEDVDYHTNCLTFVDWLKQVKDWSDKNPNAVPITILLQKHRRSRAFGWQVLAFQSPNYLGLINLDGTVAAPRPFRPWRERPNAGGERRR